MTPADERPRGVRIDATALRVLAHPLRARLLGLLRLDGPATATTLAKALDTNTGATSYHLRKLADVGLVEEAGEGHGRQRWWRAAHDMHSWSASDFAGDPDSEAALQWLEGEYFRIFTDHARDWAAEAHTWPLEWRDVAGGSDYVLDVTPGELRQLRRDLGDLLERFRARRPDQPEHPGAEAPERRRILFYTHAFPEEARREERDR